MIEELDAETFALVQKNTWGLWSGRCRMLIGGQSGDPVPARWLTNERAQQLIELGVPMHTIIQNAKIAVRSLRAELS